MSPLSRSLPSQLWNDDVCLGSCWTRLCNSCRDIGKSHIFTLANYSIWPKFFVKRHTALECWASALFMQRWPVFFRQTLHEETWKAKYSKFSDTSKTLWIFRQSEQVRASSIQRNAFLKQGIIANWKCVVSSHGFEKNMATLQKWFGYFLCHWKWLVFVVHCACSQRRTVIQQVISKNYNCLQLQIQRQVAKSQCILINVLEWGEMVMMWVV